MYRHEAKREGAANPARLIRFQRRYTAKPDIAQPFLQQDRGDGRGGDVGKGRDDLGFAGHGSSDDGAASIGPSCAFEESQRYTRLSEAMKRPGMPMLSASPSSVMIRVWAVATSWASLPDSMLTISVSPSTLNVPK